MKSLFLRTLTPFGSIKYNEKLKGESENRVWLSQEWSAQQKEGWESQIASHTVSSWFIKTSHKKFKEWLLKQVSKKGQNLEHQDSTADDPPPTKKINNKR